MIGDELFGRRVFEASDVSFLLANMLLNLLVMFVLVGLLYYRQTKDRDHTFMMVTLNLVVFLVAFFMNSVEVGVGFGFGLFALFGIVRYRTESVPVREMSFLFVTIALGLTNAIGATALSWTEVMVANVSLVVVIGTMSQMFWHSSVVVRDVVYDQIHNIRPDRQAELFDDLWDRTGINATNVELISVNLLNETAVLRVSCDVTPQAATNDSSPWHANGSVLMSTDGAAPPSGYGTPPPRTAGGYPPPRPPEGGFEPLQGR